MLFFVALATAAACLSWAFVQAREGVAASLNEDATPASDASWSDVKELIESVLGTPYTWGGKAVWGDGSTYNADWAEDGWDCSGFVGYILYEGYGLTTDMSAYNVENGGDEWSTYSIYHLLYDLGCYIGEFSGSTAYDDFAAAYAEGIVQAGDVILFYNSSGVPIHAAIVGDDASFSYAGSTAGVSIYHALNASYGTFEDSMARLWEVSGDLGSKSYTSFKVFKGLSVVDSSVVVTFTKSSGDAEITASSDYYSLDGAVYTVYEYASATELGEAVATVTLSGDGDSASGTVELEAGAAYWVVETAAPQGYELSDEWTYLDTSTTTALSLEDAPATAAVTVEKTSASTSIVTDDVVGGTSADGNASEYSFVGATFEVYRASDDELVTTVTITEGSSVEIAGLAIGCEYYLVETVAPAGFTLTGEAIHFTTTTGDDAVVVDGAALGAVTVEESAGSVYLTLQKTDASGAVQAGASLAGAVFELTDCNGTVHTAASDEDGLVAFTDVPLGAYTVREVSAPEGYTVSSEVLSGTVTADEWSNAAGDDGAISVGAGTIEETPVAFDIQIVKTLTDSALGEVTGSGEDTVLGGVQFEVYYVDGDGVEHVVATLTTDEDGCIDTADSDWCLWAVESGYIDESLLYEVGTVSGVTYYGLWFGEGERPSDAQGALPYCSYGYSVREVESTTPAGYKTAGGWSISTDSMVEGVTLKFTVNNAEVTSYIQIVKVDAETGDVVPLSGFSFQLYSEVDEDGEVVESSLVTMTDTYPTTTVLDTFTTDEDGSVVLPETLSVGTYHIVEVGASCPYLVSDEVVSFTVEDNDEVGYAATVVKVSDEHVHGQATIVKTDAESGVAVAGAVYSVIAAEDVVGADGTVLAAAGDVVCEATTGSDGTATTGLLELGADGTATYYFVETSAPEGYVLDATPVYFTLTYEDACTEVVTAGASDTDAQATGEATITKTCSDCGAAVGGVVYDVVAVDDVVGYDGVTYYEAGDVVATVTTGSDGTATVTGLRLAPGGATYAFVEASVPEGWVLDSTPVEFTVTYGDQYTAVVSASAGQTNELAMGRATIVKTCSLDGELLDGAVYDVVAVGDVVSADGVLRYEDGEVVDTVTTVDGAATTSELHLGTYAFVEVTAPEGHVLDSTPVEFTLTYEDMCTAVVSTSAEAGDAPTEIHVRKLILDTDTALEGAEFTWWAASDEVQTGVFALAADEGAEVAAEVVIDYAVVEFDLPEGWTAVFTDAEYNEYISEGESLELAAGVAYTVEVLDSEGADVLNDDLEAELTAGTVYTVTGDEAFLFFSASAKISETGEVDTSITVWYDADQGAWVSSSDEDLAGETVLVTVDGTEAGTFTYEGGSLYFSLDEDGLLVSELALLIPGAGFATGTTDADGDITIYHLGSGTYRIAETDAPAGYVADDTVYSFQIDGDGYATGTDDSSAFATDGAVLTITVEDDYTKVYVSKYDITGGEELEGAELAIYDSDGNLYDSWTSTAEPHYIEAMPEGTYTLVEVMTPRTYDEASSIEFTVEKTGEVQVVSLADEPISITGEIDKKQEVADPTALYTEENEDEANAAVSVSDEGDYDYTLDYRSTSSTWTDEFTVTDYLTCAEDGLAYLTGVTTAVAEGDYDGLMNVWYQTNLTDADYVDGSGANATLSDGHANSWLDSEATDEYTGDDDRVVDYTGWVLWAEGVSTTEATTLLVSDLELEDGEYVTAIRFEYGRVEAGFTTREDGWDAELLKDEHDDIDDATPVTAEACLLSPTIVHMRVTASYTEGTVLENEATVELYRNGGYDEDLEDQDEDRVMQGARTLSSDIAQTGSNALVIGIFTLLLALVAGTLALVFGCAPSSATKPRTRSSRNGSAQTARLQKDRQRSHDVRLRR